ncbi:MAG: DUF3108 domain-containing protein [Saprospiraceae bacterium]|nr:DUF3108 domain-containing protein [Saprospiraceae bacterium]
MKVHFKNKILAGTVLCLILSLFTAFTIPLTNETVLRGKGKSNENTVSFRGGERLVYKLYYSLGILWLPAGEIEFSVTETTTSYELKAIGKTYRSYENIFKVNDYFYSMVNKQTMLPSNFVRIVEEGKYRLYDSISFDQVRNVAVSYHGKTKGEAKHQSHTFNESMHDLMSNMYNLRNFKTENLRKGDQINLPIFFDKEVYPIRISYSGKEKKEVKGMGEFNTIKMIPEVMEGNVFKKGDLMTLWVSDDKNKIPLIIESPVSVGSVKAVLKSYSGLKYDLSSKIKE